MRQNLQQRYVGARKARIADQIEAEARHIKLLAVENKLADLRAAEIALSFKKFGILGEDDPIIYGMLAEVSDATARPDDEDAIKRLAALRKAGEPFCTKRKPKKKKSATAPEISQSDPVNGSSPANPTENDAQGIAPQASDGTVSAPPNADAPSIHRPPVAPASPARTSLNSMGSAPNGTPSCQEVLPALDTMTVVPTETLGKSPTEATTADTGIVMAPGGQGSVTAESMTPISVEDAPQANLVEADGTPVSPVPTDSPTLIAALPTPTGTPSSSQIVPASGTVPTEPTEALNDPPTGPTMADTGDAIDPGDQSSETVESMTLALATAAPTTPPPREHGLTATPQAAENLGRAPGALATDQPAGATSLDPPSAPTDHDPPVVDTASAREPPPKTHPVSTPSFGAKSFGGRHAVGKNSPAKG